MKYLREKLFPKKARFSRGKRAFAITAIEKTLENSLVMFWKKPPTREKPGKTGLFDIRPFRPRRKK
jgi:hypothetical protein